MFWPSHKMLTDLRLSEILSTTLPKHIRQFAPLLTCRGMGAMHPNEKIMHSFMSKRIINLENYIRKLSFCPPKCLNNQFFPKDFSRYWLVVHLFQWTHLLVQVEEGNLILLPRRLRQNGASFGMLWQICQRQ